ncbi:NUDIX domain-containing protein [Ornithinibacillus sp. BX22]|uniref:NUDIX domain-containing protein n=2 Tax=Ornithinibacillus TaxID=484508 RepID=A0A923L6F2_9BACI|nr:MULTISPECIES: NUDIX domain-containing protein [Ornithinibacillus]MBC5637271.1 NUDIX domain-containing protein [Ornithinibacillus hominis]MBS3680421.1 NUDIX domain-containing protein [Ornithinibacillus massiliensis]
MEKPFHHLARGILIKDNKLLVGKAKGYQNTFLPGGHIEFGESAKDALVREIREELGMRCTVGEFLGLVEHKWMNQGILNCEINQLFNIEMEDLAMENPQSIEEHIEFFWVSVYELERYHLQPFLLRTMIKGYVEGNKVIRWASSLNNEIDSLNRN